jgi:hypothetical protein
MFFFYIDELYNGLQRLAIPKRKLRNSDAPFSAKHGTDVYRLTLRITKVVPPWPNYAKQNSIIPKKLNQVLTRRGLSFEG